MVDAVHEITEAGRNCQSWGSELGGPVECKADPLNEGLTDAACRSYQAQSSLAPTSLKLVKSCIYKGSTLLLSTAQHYNHAWTPHSMQGRNILMAPSIVWLPNPVWLFILQLQKPWSAKLLALAVTKVIVATLSAYKLRALRQICGLRRHASGTMALAYTIRRIV